MSNEDVATIHAALQQMLSAHGARIDRVYFCSHARDACRCRKPLPGMFEQAKTDFPEIETATSIMIGDALCDIEFGHRLGMKTVFLSNHTAHRSPDREAAAQLADLRYGSLLEAVDALLSVTNGFPVI